jgi:protein phosphatase
VAAPARRTASSVVHDGDIALELAAVSDRGTVRDENQDAFSMVPLARLGGCVLVLADGMGGYAGGGPAADAAVRQAVDRLRDSSTAHDDLADAVAEANAAIAMQRAERGGGPAGTTLVVAVIAGGRVSLANVGDSRAYVVRGGRALQVTEDHSVIAEAVRAGHLAPGNASEAPSRSLLSRALMGEPVEADLFSLSLKPGDVLLLCSDGAWDPLGSDRLGRLVGADGPLDTLVARACDSALDAGSTDNVTLVACRMLAAPDAEPPAPSEREHR